MATTPSLGIPPLAGLATYEEAARVGLSVDENVDRMRRCNYVERRLYEISAAFLNPTPEWEVKTALSLHLWLDAEHGKALRERVAELRRPPLYLDAVPNPKLEALMEEALRAQGTLELLAGVFRVIRPALLRAYQQHLAETNPIFDHPTCRLLRIAIGEEEQMIGWGEQALATLATDPEGQEVCRRWEAHLQAYVQAAGGVSGREDVPSGLTLPAPRAAAPFVPSFDPQRDWRSGDIYNFCYRANDVYNDPEADLDERNLALMFKRFHEMDVPEMMASIILQTPGKPWEYYRDMARQVWDECRHALMGEVWFWKQGVDTSRYPNHVGWCMHLNLDRTALERHIILYAIEQGLMDGKVGKRFEWKIAQESGDPFATFLQDYDWADEVLHAQYGRRWLKPDAGDVKTILEKAREIANRPAPAIDARTRPENQTDWWPQMVRDVLGKESTAGTGMASRFIPTLISGSG
ncbi:MAG: hypothetical protein JO250_16375 [Armatimonadetes bacterium]|nr:hypothetical protein [Armatimonadota bacterium]